MTRSFFSFGFAALVAVGLIFLPSHSQAKTLKACEDEWKTNKTAIKAGGEKKKDFVTRCRAETATTPTAPLSGTAKAPTEQTPTIQKESPAAEAKPAPAARTAPRPATTAPTKAGEFTTEAEAKAHCPGDTVVWANTNSNIYHFAGTHNYGNTKSGAYMCEKDTAAAGIRAPKNEKHP